MCVWIEHLFLNGSLHQFTISPLQLVLDSTCVSGHTVDPQQQVHTSTHPSVSLLEMCTFSPPALLCLPQWPPAPYGTNKQLLLRTHILQLSYAYCIQASWCRLTFSVISSLEMTTPTPQCCSKTAVLMGSTGLAFRYSNAAKETV